MSRIVIFANGELTDPDQAHLLIRPDDYILCADGGTHHALALGLIPDLVIGDMDSVTADEFQELKRSGVHIELFPRDKDETDLELAIRHALGEKPHSILIIAALGGRLDQTLGNISLLSDPGLSAVDCRLDDGLEEVLFCRDRCEVRGGDGDLVSLIPWRGAVTGIHTEGLKWPLRGEILYPEKTRGISNEMTADNAGIGISSGLLLVIHRRKLKSKTTN